MCRSFCHLHNHTEYSLLDGANRISDMVKRAKELEMPALAISDHGVMFGAMEFFMECQKKGIKPLLGVEAYIAPKGIETRDNDYYHLLLLAKDLEGYQNLCRLSTIAALEGYYYKPRIDYELLQKHSKGLIATSTCLSGEVCRALEAQDYDRAQYIAGRYKELFGAENYFIELQDHGIPLQRECNEHLVRIAKDIGVPLVATNDAHYLCKGDARPHDVLLCIQTGALMDDPGRMKFDTQEFYIKTAEEMAALFPEHPEALENTGLVADRCNVELDKRRAPMPRPDVPEGLSSVEYLRQLAEKGLLERSKNPEAALERLRYELDVIEKTTFQDYFLLVREFAQATRDRGIYFGVRGSAAGSLVSYCLGITDVDPVEYDLTFERFLNPERISMPDIDMDFEDARRDEIIQYVSGRFGKDHVAQIITFGTLGAKAAIKDCGRVQGYSPAETDKICKTIPNLPGWSIDRAYKEIAEFREVVDGDPRFKSLVETAKSVEGMARHAGVHAAGVVISQEPLVEYVPLFRGNDGQPITAYDMGILEKIGMLKMDFLGLSNLTVLARCVENIERRTGEKLDVQKLPDGDAETFELLARGETVGVFQLEGGGMTRWVVQLKPNSIRELAAMVALYRPGPMEHIPTYIAAKFGQRQVRYLHESMRPILEESYGVIVYQDQVLKLVQAMAGFSLGKADVLRRAMGKKDAAQMAQMQGEFLEGAAERGIPKHTAEQVWELLLPFAGYAFNKAHAVCYAILAYQTAYLKAHYPVETMAALLAVYRTKEDRVTTFIEECRRMKIAILPPDINASGFDFLIENRPKGQRDAIRFGLGAIKGVGDGIVEAILAEREENGPFCHLYEFAERLKSAGINRTALDALVRAGAFDAIDRNRQKLLNHVEAALAFADMQHRQKLAGQETLFGGTSDEQSVGNTPDLPECEMPSRTQVLAWEKEVMGIYVSDHPLRGHEAAMAKQSTHRAVAVNELDEGVKVKLAGILASVRTITTKSRGEKMATVVLEDFSGQVSCTIFPRDYANLRDLVAKDALVQLTGFVSHREMRGERLIEIRVNDMKPLEQLLDMSYSGSTGAGSVAMEIRSATAKQLAELRQVIDDHPGDYQVEVLIRTPNGLDILPLVKHVKPIDSFAQAVQRVGCVQNLHVQHPDADPSELNGRKAWI